MVQAPFSDAPIAKIRRWPVQFGDASTALAPEVASLLPRGYGTCRIGVMTDAVTLPETFTDGLLVLIVNDWP